jgi:hypothetical protein
MKRKIDIKKINSLLEINKKTKKQLAIAINYPESNLCAGLSENSKRTLSMDYLIDIANFFDVEPRNITVPVVESITNIDNQTQLQNERLG